METKTLTEKYDKIMEVMTDKTLSFGCNIYVPEPYWKGYSIWMYIGGETDQRYCIYSTFATVSWSQTPKNIMLKKEHTIIGHPLRIGDVLQWGRQNNYKINYADFESRVLDYRPEILHKPIESTEEYSEVIDYLYNLIDC